MNFTATPIERDRLEEYSVIGWDRRGYLAKLGDAVSQLVNALIGGAPDESLSGRSYRICVLQAGTAPLRWRIVRRAAEAIFWLKDRGNHTQIAFWEDVYRARARARAAEPIAAAVGLRTWDSGDTLAPQPPTASAPE